MIKIGLDCFFKAISGKLLIKIQKFFFNLNNFKTLRIKNEMCDVKNNKKKNKKKQTSILKSDLFNFHSTNNHLFIIIFSSLLTMLL